MKFFAALTCLLSALSFAQVQTQTDWGGGPGVSGPITEFGEQFMSSSMIDYLTIPGRVSLQPVELSNPLSSQNDSLTSQMYPDSGFIESSILDTQLSLTPWGYLHFSSTMPRSTAIGLQVRASDDYNDMGPWSELFLYPTSLQGVLEESANYFQYRAVLYTENPDLTPVLKDVSILYSTGGTTESCSPLPQITSCIANNPSSGSVEAVVTLFAPAYVESFVFDLSGRLATEPTAIFCESGSQTVMLGEFRPGVYIVFLHTGEISSSHRFTVVQ